MCQTNPWVSSSNWLIIESQCFWLQCAAWWKFLQILFSLELREWEARKTKWAWWRPGLTKQVSIIFLVMFFFVLVMSQIIYYFLIAWVWPTLHFFPCDGVANNSLLLNCLSLPILQVYSWSLVRGAPCPNRVQGFFKLLLLTLWAAALDIVIQERVLLRDSPTSASSVPRKGKRRTRNCLPPSPTPHIWRKPAGGRRDVINKICTSTYPNGGAKSHFFANAMICHLQT